MRIQLGQGLLLLLLAGPPAFAGDIDRVPGLDAAAGRGGRSSSDLLAPPAAQARPLAANPGAFAPVTLTGSPDGAVAPPPVVGPRNPSQGSNAPTQEDLGVLTEVNRLRALHSLPAIRFDGRLFVAARAHSEEQLASNYLGHGSPDPERAKLSQRLTQGGYLGRMYAEVVASNYGDAVSVVAAWMESPTHRAVLLDTELAEGAFSRVSNPADPRVNRWTGDFGAPVLARATGPGTPSSVARPTNSAPRSAPTVAPPAPQNMSTAASATPRSPALAPPVSNRTNGAAKPADLCPGGKCGVPAPVFGSDSGSGLANNQPAPRATTPAPVVAPPTYQPAYVAPAPVPYRAPVIQRRTYRRVGDCAT